MLIYILIFILGFIIGLFFWGWVVSMKKIGRLVVDNSLKEEKPYLFLELNPGKTYYISNPNSKHVMLEVIHKDYLHE